MADLGIDGIAGGVRALAFTPSGQTFASAGGGDCSVSLWGLADGAWEEKRRFEGHDDWVNALAFSPDGKTLITASGDKSVRLWEVTSRWKAVLALSVSVPLSHTHFLSHTHTSRAKAVLALYVSLPLSHTHTHSHTGPRGTDGSHGQAGRSPHSGPYTLNPEP